MKPALSDIKNAPSVSSVAVPRPSEKTESPAENAPSTATEPQPSEETEFDYSIYDEVKGRAVDERAAWAEEGCLSDEDINRWVRNIMSAGAYKEEPVLPECIEPELHFMEEPEWEPPSMEEFERMYEASLAEAATLRETYMRSNLSLPYGDESLNRSVFELNLSDSDDECDAEEPTIFEYGF